MLWYLFFPNLASAFAPSQDFFIGIEPNRVYRYHIEQQHKLRHSTDWQHFISTEGKGWKARFDEKTGLAHRAWGKGIPMGNLTSEADARKAVRDFLQRNPGLINIKLSQLSSGDAGYDADIDAWYVHFDQLIPLRTPAYDDLNEKQVSHAKVWRGGFDGYVRTEKLTMLGTRLYAEPLKRSWQATYTASQALDIAIHDGPAPDANHENIAAELVLLPLADGAQLAYHLCWQLRSESKQPLGHWVSFVDAESGELVHVYNEIRFLEGNIHGEHDTRTIDGNFSVSPLPFLTIPLVEGGNEITDEDGNYSFDVDAESLTLRGRYTTISNQDGEDFAFDLAGGEQEIAADGEEFTYSQIDQFVFQNHIYAWAEDHAPHIVDNWSRSSVSVNINDNCNAYFDGTLNFFRKGEGCNNTGRIADVSYHEWGHGFHYYNLLSGDYDGSMSEGIADSVAFFQTDDPFIAPYFGQSGWAIRRVDEDRVYPEDVVGEVHTDGLIFAGAVWDFWGLMRDRFSDEDAYDRTMGLFVRSLRSGPDIPSSYDSFFFADDDNADLSDGTPHECEIVESFGRHGLGPNAGNGFLELSHQPIGNQLSTASEYTLQADLLRYAESCIDSEVDRVVVKFSTDNGETWAEQDLIASDDTINGAIPSVDAMSVVHYFIELTDGEGNITTIPKGATINPFSFYVGELEELYCNDFETDDGGFTHELVAGQNQEGADDWMWGTPIGLGGDPDFAYSGNNVWGNDLGGEINGENYNGEYQNEKHNRLTSTIIDTQGHEQVVLVYQRWLSVEDGFYDQATIEANGNQIWNNHATRYEVGDEHHLDAQWTQHVIPIEMNGESGLQVAWNIQSDGGLTMGGWNIDNVCVYGMLPPPAEADESDEDDVDAETSEKEAGGCGCSASKQPANGWAWALILGVMAFARRRT